MALLGYDGWKKMSGYSLFIRSSSVISSANESSPGISLPFLLSSPSQPEKRASLAIFPNQGFQSPSAKRASS